MRMVGTFGHVNSPGGIPSGVTTIAHRGEEDASRWLFLRQARAVALGLALFTMAADVAGAELRHLADKPIDDPALFMFREIMFSADDDLCGRFVGAPGRFQLPKGWQPATNVIIKDIRDDKPFASVGYWVNLDIANNGHEMIVLAMGVGVGGQGIYLFDINVDQFLSLIMDRFELNKYWHDIISVSETSQTLEVGGAQQFLRIGMAYFPLGYFSAGRVSPVIIDGKILFAASVEESRWATHNNPNGMLFLYKGRGKIEHICYFDN